jgi:hypothetical protein
MEDETGEVITLFYDQDKGYYKNKVERVSENQIKYVGIECAFFFLD